TTADDLYAEQCKDSFLTEVQNWDQDGNKPWIKKQRLSHHDTSLKCLKYTTIVSGMTKVQFRFYTRLLYLSNVADIFCLWHMMQTDLHT
ncbi:hypothetical protein MAR_000518, partial [Mya arenaria]